jgi:two-component system, chemotaxis family, protein-glutamate methylesterase/glutaminase
VSEPVAGTSAARPSPSEPPRFQVVALAASAGGVGALSAVLGALPASLPVPVLVVQHLDRRHETIIAEVLQRRTPLVVTLAHDDQQAHPGTVYVAPPNRHLLSQRDGTLTLTATELVHFVRPSADLLFESVAGAYGDRAIAVVLTGSGSDGAMGIRAIHDRGGTVIVQDPASADFTGMPRAAVETGDTDFVLPLDEIGPVVCQLVMAGETR